MGQDSSLPPTREVGRGARFVESIVSRLPARTSRFLLRFIGVFASRRMSMMAAVSAFWVIFAFPWILIVFIFVSSLISKILGNQAVQDVEQGIIDLANRFLTPEAANQFAIPILDSIFAEGLAELGIIGLVVALWSGSKAALSLMDAITFIEENVAPAGYVVRRSLALGMLLGGLIAMAIVAPLLLVGPRQLGEWLKLPSEGVWVLVIGLSFGIVLLLLILLYKVATFHSSKWNTYIPGAALATVVSGFGLVGLGIYIRRMFENNAFLGALLTPIAMMTTAYVLCLFVLAGAVFNYVKSFGADVDGALTEPMAVAVAKFDGSSADELPADASAETGTKTVGDPGEPNRSG